jgi:hypothetical protein
MTFIKIKHTDKIVVLKFFIKSMAPVVSRTIYSWLATKPRNVEYQLNENTTSAASLMTEEVW